jgi:hypothetical protein
MGLSGAAQILTGEIGAAAPVITAFASGAALTVPIIGAAIAGVTLLVGAWMNSIAKHNAEKTQATAIVNQAEPLLKQNLAAFQSLANPTRSEQAAALSNFDAIWSQVVSACSSSSLEDAGKRCISDRSAGGRWNWAGYYRDPIANAANVVPDSLGTTDPLGAASAASVAAGLPSWLPYAALLVGAVLLFKD